MTHTARDYRGSFEVHLTAAIADEAARAAFREWCDARELKCVWIVLARGQHTEQPMATWRRNRATLPAVLAEANLRASELVACGVPVARVKIETAPFNDGVPQRDSDTGEHAPTNYFEHHAKLLRPANAPRDVLLSVCAAFGAHLSRNALRDTADGHEERFATLRCYGVGALTAEERFARFLTALRASGETVLESESEYCVYDSALALDAGWLAGAAH